MIHIQMTHMMGLIGGKSPSQVQEPAAPELHAGLLPVSNSSMWLFLHFPLVKMCGLHIKLKKDFLN